MRIRRGGLRVLLEMKPVIAITAGDPAGIGPEIAMKAASDAAVREICDPIIYGPHKPADLAMFPTGQVSASAGRAAYDAILMAVTDALEGRVHGIATAPIN